MNEDNRNTRREFLGNFLRTGSLTAMGCLVGIGLSRDACGLSDQNQSNPASTARIDPNMILYEETGEAIPTGFSESRALASDASGFLYVAGDQTIKVIDPRGGIKDTFTLTVSPRCVAPAEKELYIGTRDRVVVIDRKGEVQATWPSLGDNAVITGIALDDEHVCIADAGQRTVWCFDRKGQFIRRIGDKDPERDIPGFVVPSPYFDLAIAPDGLLRVANPGRHRIEAYTFKGDLEVAWGKFGNSLADFTACCNPMSFDIMADGSFITYEKGITRIKVYDANGRLTGVVAGPEQLISGVWSVSRTQEQTKRARFDVAADAAGHVYILDRIKGVVRIFSLKA